MKRTFTKYPSNYVKASDIRQISDKSQSSINQILEQIKSDIERIMHEPAYQHEGEDWQVGLNIAENIIDEYIK